MKNKIITTIVAITIIMSTLLALAGVNTSALAVADETPAPTAVVVFDETPAPTLIPVSQGHPVLQFTIDQKTIYTEKTIITGALDNNYDYKFIVKVNGIEFETIIVPKSEDGKFSMELDFSDCSVGDKVTFTAYLADGFVVSPYGKSFHFEKRPAKTSKKSKAIKLNKKKVTLKVGKKVKLKLKGAKKGKVKWSCNKKKIARVRNGVVKAKKPGKCKITAKYLGKKYKCKVTVTKRNKKDKNDVKEKDVGLQLEWKDDSYKTAVLKIVNNSKQEITTGYGDITLQKFAAGKWENIAILDTAPPVPAIAVIIKPKQEWSETISIKDYFGELSAGEYILSKRVYANGKVLFPNVKFTVPSNAPVTTATPTSTPVVTPTPEITPTQYPKDDFMPGEVLVGMKGEVTIDEFIALCSDLDMELVERKHVWQVAPGLKVTSFRVVLKEKTKTIVEDMIEVFKQNPLVEYAEPNYIMYPA